MAPRPANTVNILGQTYTVKRLPYIDRNAFITGEISFEAQEIRILDTLTDDHAGVTFFHEFIHGVLCGLKYPAENDDEKLVQGLAIGIYQALKDNPDILNVYRREPCSSTRKVLWPENQPCVRPEFDESAPKPEFV